MFIQTAESTRSDQLMMCDSCCLWYHQCMISLFLYCYDHFVAIYSLDRLTTRRWLNCMATISIACIGTAHVPQGSWYCPSCIGFNPKLQARVKRSAIRADDSPPDKV
jgi:hypothetical protein